MSYGIASIHEDREVVPKVEELIVKDGYFSKDGEYSIKV